MNARTSIIENKDKLIIETSVKKKIPVILTFIALIYVSIFILAYNAGFFKGYIDSKGLLSYNLVFPLARIIFSIALTLFLVFYFIWLIAGKEILIFGNEKLIYKRKSAIFSSPREFNLNEIENFGFNFLSRNRNKAKYGIYNIWQLDNKGVIRFLYKNHMYTLGREIDEKEANYLLELLKSKYISNNPKTTGE